MDWVEETLLPLCDVSGNLADCRDKCSPHLRVWAPPAGHTPGANMPAWHFPPAPPTLSSGNVRCLGSVQGLAGRGGRNLRGPTGGWAYGIAWRRDGGMKGGREAHRRVICASLLGCRVPTYWVGCVVDHHIEPGVPAPSGEGRVEQAGG